MSMLAQITIDASMWGDVFSTLGPLLGVAAVLAIWQMYVVRKFENKKMRTSMLYGSSVLILLACLLALVVGFYNSK